MTEEVKMLRHALKEILDYGYDETGEITDIAERAIEQSDEMSRPENDYLDTWHNRLGLYFIETGIRAMLLSIPTDKQKEDTYVKTAVMCSDALFERDKLKEQAETYERMLESIFDRVLEAERNKWNKRDMVRLLCEIRDKKHTFKPLDRGER